MPRTYLSGLVAACLVAPSVFADIAMPEVVSHRGESNDRPENSMAAFRLAFERGVDGVECDVYCTSDGVPVIIHDATTGRTAGSGTNLTVTSSTWDQLKDVRIGAFSPWTGTEWEGETLPKFEDYLALLSMNTTTKCIVELKGNGANNLVAKVVEAVQAQPLATKDRVAFIAFDASLISAVRAALPDYDALLLLSSVSDSAATINSKIAACNATGVDIHYQAAAAQSATEIQAVKAAGYKFWVWTCDDVNASFALASRGVQSVTTNKGGETKTAVAAMIAEAESREEIVEPNFPAGATIMEPSAYVQTGLVGHFDAIRNVGMNLPHDNSATTWKNLASGGPDATFTHRSNSPSPGYWTDKSYYFNNGTMASTVSALNLGNNFTVQIAINASPSGQAPTTTSANGSNNYHAWFNDHPKGNRGFWTYSHKNGNNGKDLVGNFDKFGGPRINIVNWGGKYVTWMLDGANGKAYTFEDAAIPTSGSLVQSMTVKTSNISSMHCWGGEQEGTRLQAFLKGDYYSVRMYNRVLTNDEHVWNRIVDEVRYRGVVTNGTVVVASNRAGAEGTEASGTYYVNGNHTFTVPASVTIDGCVYEPTGYKFETYNASTKTWNFVEERTDLSFAYTNCAANTGARITWNWRLVSGVKKIDADDYVYGGLVLGFDGIRNAGLGMAHDSSTTTWKNLGDGSDAVLTEVSAERGMGSWTANGYDFTAGSCFETLSELALASQATIQFAVEYNASRQVVRWPCFFSAKLDSDRFLAYTYTPLAGAGIDCRGDHLRFNSSSITDLSFGLQPWDGRLATQIIDYNRASNTNTANYGWQTGKYKADVGTYKYGIGAGRGSASHRLDRAYLGVYHAFRLYDRVLTEAEIAHNLEIDNVRYYAGASRSSDTNVMEVAVESPGGVVTVDEKGSWIVRGEGASKTFTAPATVTVGNNTYSCTGYRIETWNAAKRMWENPVETAAETSGDLMVELRSTNTNRRLTWLYALTSGIRSAADYDVGDYVQQGLVANYDGIRNFGPSSPHGTLSQYWLDSSYRDVPMVAASNTAFNAWIGLGHHFTAAEQNFFQMAEPISLGQNGTVQGVLDTVPTSQTTSYPTYFGFGNADYSFFTRSNNKQRLESKYTDWVGGNLYKTSWGGQYFTWMMDANTHWLFQGTVPGAGTERTKTAGVPEKKFAIGGPNTYTGNDRKIRCMSGDYYALRIYNRALTEAELEHNRMVDEIRYRGNFTNANVTVVCEVPFEGVEAPVAVPAGDYEVTGSFTFTAGGLTVGESTFPVRYTVETWDGTAWGEPVEYEGGSYAYTAGAKVRLTWKWADPTVPVKATWTGAGEAGNLLDPANWSCVNAAGETIVAAPGEHTSVTICGTTSFSIPEGVTAFPWKDIRFADTNAHAATRLGSLALASNAGFSEMGAGHYTLAPAADAVLSGLNGGNDGGPHETWQKTYVQKRRARFDGWINVTAAQAGTWEIRQGYDDYFGFAIDGEWLILNNTYVYNGSATADVSAGWHRFTIVCGDTSGGYGSTATTGILVNGEYVPLAITAGGNVIAFTGSGFAFGSGAPGTITLSGDCDWSALGNARVADGTTIDLNGHNLSLSSISSEYLGTVITNSNDAVLSTVTFTAPEGAASTNNVAICGNVKVVKKGPGPYYAYATGCTYTGGTFIDEGTAQPPDGTGTNDIYSYDKFKAFGLGEIVVASNAVFDLRANYAYRGHVVLAGGTLTNGKAEMAETGWGGSGIGRLEADSALQVTPHSIVFGDNNAAKGGNMDLGGHTLTVDIDGSGKRLYLRCAKIENGKIDIQSGGWLQVVNACVATNVDFKMNCALNIGNTLSVRDYEALWTSNNTEHNAGTAALNVYGTFRPNPSHDRFYGCTMQDGSTIDLSGRTGAFSTLSTFTTGSTNLQFAAGANVTVNLAGRTDLRTIVKSENPFVVTWPEGLGPAASVTFQVDAETKRNRFKIVRDDGRNGLRLVRASGFTLIVR